MQFLNKVFADCGYWHIDKAADVPVTSSTLLLDIFIQFGRADAVFTMSSSLHG